MIKALVSIPLAVFMVISPAFAGPCSCEEGSDAGPGPETIEPGGGASEATLFLPQGGEANPGNREDVPGSALEAAYEARRKEDLSTDGGHDVLQPVVIYPERVIWVAISATDVNRIVCTGGKIDDVFFSIEKGVKVEVAGHEAYLKIEARVDPEKKAVEYSTVPSDVYVVCGGETFGFIGRPARIPSRTLYLASPGKDAERAANSLTTTNVDKGVTEIVEKVLRDDVSLAWEEREPRALDPASIPGAEIRAASSWRIPGVGLLVRTIGITAKTRATLTETDLLTTAITVNPVAVAVERHDLSPGESTRAVIVESVVGDEPL